MASDIPAPVDPTRRRMLMGAGLLAAFAGAGAFALARHLRPPPALATADGDLADEAMRLLDAVTEAILPRTDTPGARDVGVAAFMRLLYRYWMPAATQTWFATELDRFAAGAHERYAASFADLTAAQQLEYLSALEAAATGAAAPFIVALKSLTLFGYYTSEAGATQELSLNLVPGVYQPCRLPSPELHAPSIPRSLRLQGVIP